MFFKAGVRVLSARAAAEEVKQIKGAGNLESQHDKF